MTKTAEEYAQEIVSIQNGITRYEGKGYDQDIRIIAQAIREAEQRIWSLAHDPAKCGHARANYKDPNYGTPEYHGDEKCDACEAEKRGMLRAAEIVDRQAEDEGLWFQAQTASEAYLQQELRRLHAAIEGKTPEECALEVLEASDG